MRLITILALMAMVVMLLCQPALPKSEVTVIQGSQRFKGWTMDNGRIFVENDDGKIIMNGLISRTGVVELYSQIRDDSFVGQVNPMGKGLLMSPKTGETLRIEVQR